MFSALRFHLPDRHAALSQWQRVAEPERVYNAAGRLLPWFWGAAGLLGAAGLVAGLLLAPADFHQGDAGHQGAGGSQGTGQQGCHAGFKPLAH